MAEMVIKIIAFNISEYWKSPWNRFDCFVVFSSILDLILASIG